MVAPAKLRPHIFGPGLFFAAVLAAIAFILGDRIGFASPLIFADGHLVIEAGMSYVGVVITR